MAVTLFVWGEIQYGRLGEFLAALDPYRRYRLKKGWVGVEALVGMAGPMNSVCLVYRYPDAKALEEEEAESNRDVGYLQVAGALCFREPTIVYGLYRNV